MVKSRQEHREDVLKELEHLVEHLTDLRFKMAIIIEERDTAVAKASRHQPCRPARDMGQ